MRPESREHLEDARAAARQLTGFVASKSRQDYHASALLRAAVERQFEIIGEALNRVYRGDRDTALLLPDYRRIVAFRNILVHGYHVVEGQLQGLMAGVEKLLSMAPSS